MPLHAQLLTRREIHILINLQARPFFYKDQVGVKYASIVLSQIITGINSISEASILKVYLSFQSSSSLSYISRGTRVHAYPMIQ